MSKKGFRRSAPLYALKFEVEEGEENEFDGLEVMAKSLPLAEFFELGELQQLAEQDIEAAKKIMRRLADVIVSWNVEDEDGKPVPAVYAVCTASGKPGDPGKPCSHHQNDEGAAPCSYDGLVSLDFPFVMNVFLAWQEAVANIPNLSRRASTGGGTSQEPLIEMDVLSASPGS